MPVTPDDQKRLRLFWERLEPHHQAVNEEVRAAAERIPEFSQILRSIPPEQTAAEDQRNHELQRAALRDGQWGPYLDNLRAQGKQYARMGLAFKTWFDLLSSYRAAVRVRVLKGLGDDEAVDVREGMNRYVDLAMATIGEAYLHAKEELIERQQEAIRELSTPVLRVREGMLILPVVGVIDTDRARHLTEAMLMGVRKSRARAVIMDITGVPIVDSKVANHLAQACEAARLMGAQVIVTGISPEIAQTLVAVGAELRGAVTLGDLEHGIARADRILGFMVVRRPDESATGERS